MNIQTDILKLSETLQVNIDSLNTQLVKGQSYLALSMTDFLLQEFDIRPFERSDSFEVKQQK